MRDCEYNLNSGFICFRVVQVLICFLIMFADVKSFSGALSGRKGSGFYTCGQLCRLIRRLAGRCFVSSAIPKETDWDEILAFDVETSPLLTPAAFLQRLDLEDKVTQAAKRKADSDLCDKRNKEGLDKLSTKLKEDLALLGCDFVRMLLRSVTKHISLTHELVKGMACFDPKMLFRLPVELSSKHFTILYRSFSSRKWIAVAEE